MSRIVINGESFEVHGNNIVVTNDSITVDGETIKSGLSGIIKVQWEGDVANLTAHNVEISGTVKGDVNAHNVDCHLVGGNVTAHNVDCGDVVGNVNAKNVN